MAELTMLVDMMDQDTERAVEDLVALGIRQLDLRLHVFGKPIAELDDGRREQLAALLERTGTSAYCFSSTLGHRDIRATDERTFRQEMEQGVANMIATAQLVRPARVRLLSCWLAEYRPTITPIAVLDAEAPWVMPAYRDAVDQLTAAGLTPTIENEFHAILGSPQEVLAFFERLDRPGASYTWDVQNMWQSGTYPSVEAYRALRPVMDYLHLKGGRDAPEAPGQLVYRCPLDQASWPVREIVAATLADGASPVICLNGTHGKVADDYEFKALAGTPAMVRAEALRDVAFLRETFTEIV